MPPKKNAPRFLDYRRSPLPLDVALSFAIPTSGRSTNNGDGVISARDLILSGRVRVNDSIETSCHRLVHRDNDCIAVMTYNNGRDDDDDDDEDKGDTTMIKEALVVVSIAMPRYFICYKPRGVVCSTKKNEGIDRMDSVLISDWLENVSPIIDNDDAETEKACCDSTVFSGGVKSMAIKTVGRLDEDSEGILLLTNDGSFSRLLCDPEFGLRKTYRVVVRGSCYRRMMVKYGLGSVSQSDNHKTNDEENEKQSFCRSSNDHLLAERVAEMIKLGNQPPPTTTNGSTKCKKQNNEGIAKPHFPFESCDVLDAGKLPSQHASDDSYYALVDLVLREGKRHAVRRIIKNAGGQLRVCYLSRIAVEGLMSIDNDGVTMMYDVAKPNTIVEAREMGFLLEDGERHQKIVPSGKLLLRPDSSGCTDGNDCPLLLHPGNVVELRECDIDGIFVLRR